MSPKGKKLLIAISAVLIAVIVVFPSVYLLYTSSKQAKLIVNNGSASYTFMFGFSHNNQSINSVSFKSYSTTTTLDEGGLQTILEARMNGSAYASSDQPNVFFINLFLNLSGRLPYNLTPTFLTISVGALPGSPASFLSHIGNNIAQWNSRYQKPVNISTSEGGENLKMAFLNDTGLNRNQTFSFSLTDFILSPAGQALGLQYNTTYGLSITASLSGLSQPVSTTLYIFFIDVPKG